MTNLETEFKKVMKAFEKKMNKINLEAVKQKDEIMMGRSCYILEILDGWEEE